MSKWFVNEFQARTDTREAAVASLTFSSRSTTVCAMSALTRLALANTDSERGPVSCGVKTMKRRVALTVEAEVSRRLCLGTIDGALATVPLHMMDPLGVLL